MKNTEKSMHVLKTKQAGISLIGLILTMGVLVLIAMLAMKVVPTVIEFQSIKKAVISAAQNGKSVREIQEGFNRAKQSGYFDAISSQDLVFTRNGNEIEVSFAYEKKIPLVGPASLLLEYTASTAKNPSAE